MNPQKRLCSHANFPVIQNKHINLHNKGILHISSLLLTPITFFEEDDPYGTIVTEGAAPTFKPGY